MNTISFGYSYSVSDEPVYEVLALHDAGGGYNWSVDAILRRLSDGQLFYVADGGCSCNYFGSSSPHTLEPIESVDEGLRKADDSEVREGLQRSLDRGGDA